MQTFAVSDVAPAERPLRPITLEHALAMRLEGPHDGASRPIVEACGANQAQLVGVFEHEVAHP